jgi:hypothetical protein
VSTGGQPRGPTPPATFWTPGEGIAWVAALVLMLSAFMGWYSGSGDGLSFSVLAWHTGVVGKLVFFVGLAVLVLLGSRAAGFELPPAIPTGMVLALLGTAATILVIIRLIEIPDRIQPAGRSIGIWISLAAAVLLIAAGLLKSADEL